jgi:hypothetical protein
MSCDNIIDYAAKKIEYRKQAGDHFNLTLTVKDGDGLPIDLSTSDDIQFFVDEVEVASLGDGITVSGTDNNIITITKVDARAAGSYQYEIVITDSAGLIRTYFKGKLTEL